MGQPQQPEIKIRALPRGNERKAAAKPVAKKKSQPRWIIYVGAGAFVALLSALALPGLKPPQSVARNMTAAAPQKMQQTDLASVQSPINAKISRHLQDSHFKEEVMRRQLALENARLKDPSLSVDTVVVEDDGRNYGVQLDQEDTADKLYRDLNYRQPVSTDFLPEERINAKLANNKWINEHERAERVNFVRNFILSAYERGYEVEIDANLVVVGVRKVNRRLSIDQIMDRMSKQGGL
ncbi:MAG: hypothetical protein KF799_01570 [Bdellovibrionales bacterium]|nr:hypothetical protein [Bdellovibrionales bacterium]